MDTGKLRHYVTIEQRATTQNTFGEQAATWTTYSTAWASIQPTTGREYFFSAQRHAEVTHKVNIRANSGVKPKMRISFNSRYFDIKDVLNVDERGFEMVLMCTEVIT